MRVGKTWALKGFALGPMTLRPFAGERLMAVREDGYVTGQQVLVDGGYVVAN